MTGRSCHKYHFCRDKSFVGTNTCLSGQNYVYRDKIIVFIVIKLSLSRPTFCRGKIFLS